MAPLRSLLVLLILIGLVSAATAVAQAPVQWYTEPGGGTVAGPAPDLHGGGAVAPLATEPGGAASPAPERKEAAEPKPSGAAPASPSSRSHSGGATATAAAAAASEAHPASAAAAQSEPADSQSGPIAALPFTGLELFVIVTAGLCLLLAGAVLRPRTARR